MINAKHTDCANFTQMLWKSSLQVGIALSCSSNGAPPLRLSKRLCKYSQQWANTLAIRGRLEHRPHSEYGENLYCTWDLDSTPSKNVSRDLSNYSWSHSEITSEFSGASRNSLKTKQSSAIAQKARSESRLSNETPTSPAGTTFLTTSRATSSCSDNLPSLCSGKVSPCVGFKSASVNGKYKFCPNISKSLKKSPRSIPERPVTAPPKPGLGSKIVRRSSCVFPQRSNTIPRPSAFERRQIRTASLCSGSVPERLHTPPNGREAVERWYAEVGQHEFYKEPTTLRTGHFTQVVWNDSRELGVGIATNKQGQTFIVANYHPPGNFLGSFTHNVPPIGGFRTMLSDEEEDNICNGKSKNNNESSGESDDMNRKIHKDGSAKSRKKIIERHKMQEYNDKNIARINGIINNKLHEIYEWDEFVLQGLKVHNEYRKKHGVPNLVLSQELCESARDWSLKLSRLNKFKHKPGCEFGENIFVVWSSDVSDHVSARDVVRCWYEEGREYDWDAKEKARGGAQFTQIIWRATKELGMAVSSNGRGKIYVVANYRPRGNVIGQFSENVNKPL
ncbi:uncharacterized protein LOC113385604 [Ctenocephalides felis]|uniref:uncharacterized protein LOC113385604 n=1 Tax=Ctenocephalides felis TaxID=7515 RepID=UPI000E6E4284|nr:uncharacterized protein LOC113385604 [Ctenocephalides felis]